MPLRAPLRRFTNLNLGSVLPRKQIIFSPAKLSRPSLRVISSSRPFKMSNDDDYMAFLNKANQDTGAGASTQEKTVFKAKDHGVEVPKAISEVCKKAVYTSDADEPFEEVSLKWQGENGLPTESK